MNDFSNDTDNILYSKEYKEPKKKLEFLDVSGSMSGFRIVSSPLGNFHSGMSYYCAELAQKITDEGNCLIKEMLERLSEERILEKERKQDEINRSWNRVARTFL